MTDAHLWPETRPAPRDDGAADHLVGLGMPSVTLKATDGRLVNLVELGPGRTILYLFPLTAQPGQDLPTGWDLIPGARGCTPEACAFRDHHAELKLAGANVFGLSSQESPYQREAVDRLQLPFAFLSDPPLQVAQALRLPSFEVDGMRLFARLTLIVRDDVIEHVFYPVFPTDTHAEVVLAWLREFPF